MTPCTTAWKKHFVRLIKILTYASLSCEVTDAHSAWEAMLRVLPKRTETKSNQVEAKESSAYVRAARSWMHSLVQINQSWRLFKAMPWDWAPHSRYRSEERRVGKGSGCD